MGNYSLGQGLVASGFSILIVFGVLILLSFIISLLKYLGKDDQPVKKERKENKAKPAPTAQALPGDEGQVIAAIVASCLASEEKN